LSYRVSRAEVGSILGRLFKASHLNFRDTDCLERALERFVRGRGDFADYLIQEHARTAGCAEVATFDSALLRENGFAAPR
jgi:predicted nucleic-acid-binding protein